jgi:O-antigen/teichoic acid export membrane protein
MDEVTMKEILKGSFIIFIFKVLGALSLFASYMLIPRYYGIEAFGIFNLIFALLMIATVISRLGLDTYVVRIIPSFELKDETLPLFLKAILKTLFLSSFVVCLLLLASSNLINNYFFKSIDASTYLLILAFMVFPYTFFNVLVEIFRGLDEIKIYAFFRNFSQNFMVFILVLISIVSSWMFDPVYILYGAILIITLSLSLTLYKFLKHKEIKLYVKGKYKEKILKHSYPMFLAASVMFLMGYTDSFMISYYLDEYQVGIYNACISLSMMLTFIPIAIGGYISPKIAKAYSQHKRDEIKSIFQDSMKIIFVVTLAIFGVMYFYGEFFLGLFGEAFHVATLTLLLTNIAFLSEALTGPVGFILNMTDNQHIFMRILIVSLLINVLFNMLLIPIYGINGAAIALLFSMFFWTIGSYLFLKHKAII